MVPFSFNRKSVGNVLGKSIEISKGNSSEEMAFPKSSSQQREHVFLTLQMSPGSPVSTNQPFIEIPFNRAFLSTAPLGITTAGQERQWEKQHIPILPLWLESGGADWAKQEGSCPNTTLRNRKPQWSNPGLHENTLLLKTLIWNTQIWSRMQGQAVESHCCLLLREFRSHTGGGFGQHRLYHRSQLFPKSQKILLCRLFSLPPGYPRKCLVQAGACRQSCHWLCCFCNPWDPDPFTIRRS